MYSSSDCVRRGLGRGSRGTLMLPLGGLTPFMKAPLMGVLGSGVLGVTKAGGLGFVGGLVLGWAGAWILAIVAKIFAISGAAEFCEKFVVRVMIMWVKKFCFCLACIGREALAFLGGLASVIGSYSRGIRAGVSLSRTGEVGCLYDLSLGSLVFLRGSRLIGLSVIGYSLILDCQSASIFSRLLLLMRTSEPPSVESAAFLCNDSGLLYISVFIKKNLL